MPISTGAIIIICHYLVSKNPNYASHRFQCSLTEWLYVLHFAAKNHARIGTRNPEGLKFKPPSFPPGSRIM